MILHILFLALLLKESNAFTFQICSESDGSNCLDQIFKENSFQAEIINNLYQQNTLYHYILINQVDNTDDITLNLDNINDSISIYFQEQSFSSPITIQTNAEKDTENYFYPSVFATGRDLLIENINPQNDKTLFLLKYIECDKIYSKDNSKPLYMLHKYEGTYRIYIEKFESNPVYFSSNSFELQIEEELSESKTMIITPYIRHAYDNYYFEYLRFSLKLSVPTKVIYGENQVRIEFANSKSLTLFSETHKIFLTLELYEDTTITCDEDFNEYDLIAVDIKVDIYSKKTIKLQGNWPIVKTIHLDEEYIGDGKIVDSISKFFGITGTILFNATNFPVKYVYYSTFILIENSSSIYLLDSEIIDNVTILTSNEIETVFRIDGIPSRTYYRDDDDYYYYNSFLITESPLLTIIGNTNKNFALDGPASIYYNKIDNRQFSVDSVLSFLKGGTIVLPFGVDYDIIYKDGYISDKFHEVYDGFSVDNLEPPEESNSNVWINYFVDFLKNKISDVSSIINNITNKFLPPITINLKNNDLIKLKSTISLVRTDIFFSPLYSNSLNKEINVLCLQDGTFDLSEWIVKLDRKIFRGFVEEGYENDILFNIFSPSFFDSSFSFSTSLTENGRCIAIKPTSIPKSVFELFVYTKNETYIELIEKFDCGKILTPTDLDASSKIINKMARNIMIIVLDDLPEGSSINLNGIQRNTNVFLIGFKIEYLNDLVDLIRNEHDMESSDFAEFANQFASRYTSYRPSVSITFNSVQTLIAISVNYIGTKIRCSNFWAILSSFDNLVKNPNNFEAQITLTETLTYQSISSLKFKDLVIFPISLDPLNILTIEQVNFTENDWSLKLTEFIKDEGYTKDEDIFYSIKNENIGGQLFLYSFDYTCIFTIPETKSGQKIKGISFNCFSFLSPKINNIHGIFTLESNDNLNSFSNKFFGLFENKINFFENEDIEKNDHFTFNGNWDKVSIIEGDFEINAPDVPVIIENVPTVVAESLDVKSDKNIQITTSNEKMVFNKPQIISQSKTISFQNKNTVVTFSNLTFNGNSPSLSLLINGTSTKVVTDHILIESGTYAKVSSELEVKESFEFGPESSLKANLISPKNVKLTMNYRLGAKIGSIPESIEPETIVLNYIGESENLEDETDYSIYLGVLNDIQNFNGNDHIEKCQNWKEMTSLQSDFFPEFREDGEIVQVICINKESSSTLAINVTSIPEGEVILPTEDDDFFDPSDDEFGNDGNGNGGGGKNKKKISFFALVGIIVGCVVLVVIIIVITVVYRSMSKKEKNKSENEAEEVEEKNSQENKSEGENKPEKTMKKDVPEVVNKANITETPEQDEDSDIDFWMYP